MTARIVRHGVVLLLVLLSTSPARAATFARANHAFSIVQQGSFRTMAAGSSTTVHLRVRNDGALTWTDAHGVHFAYHWLGTKGRLIQLDGERTALPHDVPPGAVVDLDARVIAPAEPGLYRLQWDMVEENVTWFSQEDPYSPVWHYVLVQPDAALYATVVMPLFALLGWISIRRRGTDGWAASRLLLIPADVLWAAGSLIGIQLLFMLQAGVTPAATADWASVVVSLVLCAAALLIPRRWRVWVNWALVAGGISLLFADLLYVRYFNDMLSLAVLRSSGQTGDVWDSVVGLLQRSDVWWFVNLPCGVLLARAVASLPEAPRLSRWRQRAIGFACVVVAIAVGQPVGASSLLHDPTLKKFFRNLAVVERVGPLGFHALDVWQDVENDWLRPALTPAELAETRRWFADHSGSRAGAGPAFGAARGMNIIAIQVESFQRFVVGLQVNGQEITPNLNRWTRDALWFSHTTDQTSEGRSSDAEFITMTSLLPLEHGAVAFRYGSNHYVGLPAVLADHGYSTLSAVPLEGSFWNSRVTHQQYGITNNLFRGDFTIGEQVGWGLNDRDFFREMMPRLRAARQPFFAWLLTLSLHHPFDGFPDDLRVLRLGDLERTPFGNYLEGLHFFDAALGDLEAQLQSAGLLDRTIIVIYGDHDAGFGWDGRLSPYIGHARTAVEWLEQDAVPLFIRVPGHPELSGEHSTPAGLTDVPPTLLALVGIDPSGLPYVGRNLLGNPGDEPLVRPYGSWIDSRHVFLQQGEGQDRCGDAASGQVGPAASCQAANQAALKELEMSRRVIAYDLQTKLAAQALSASGSVGPASWAHKRR